MQRLPVVLSVTALVVALLGWTGVGEAAKNMITGKQIKNRTISGVDVKKRALTGGHVKDGTLRLRDFREGEIEMGVKGDKGDQGDKGDPGIELLGFYEVLQSGGFVQPGVTAIIKASCDAGDPVTGGGHFTASGFDTYQSEENAGGWFVKTNNNNAGAATARASVICADFPPAHS